MAHMKEREEADHAVWWWTNDEDDDLDHAQQYDRQGSRPSNSIESFPGGFSRSNARRIRQLLARGGGFHTERFHELAPFEQAASFSPLRLLSRRDLEDRVTRCLTLKCLKRRVFRGI